MPSHAVATGILDRLWLEEDEHWPKTKVAATSRITRTEKREARVSMFLVKVNCPL
ncbi:hypothetical protein F2Q69_00000230 [Brassica cretica]|uniref:Uncharacterized protein n=1 Tax=Brassica cretica TaxID=69181 RepID=A0A8S9PAS1_BRACR|nr:hypothetical protein F2Q69_00000230 [Brassica cretica]